MPSYTYQPELPHGLPIISQTHGFLTPPDTPPNELESMVQELSHGLPSLDADFVMEDNTIDSMLIDEEQIPDLVSAARDNHDLVEEIGYILLEYAITIEELEELQELCYGLVDFYVDGQWGFTQDRVEEFLVVIEYWGLKEQFSGYEQGGVPEMWNWALDDLLWTLARLETIRLLRVLRELTPQAMILFRFIQQ